MRYGPVAFRALSPSQHPDGATDVRTENLCLTFLPCHVFVNQLLEGGVACPDDTRPLSERSVFLRLTERLCSIGQMMHCCPGSLRIPCAGIRWCHGMCQPSLTSNRLGAAYEANGRCPTEQWAIC